MSARIFRPAKSATQSGMARTRRWQLVYAPARARTIEPLMGWTSSDDMNSQVRLSFATKQEAVAYCETNAIPYTLEEPAPAQPRRPMSYSDNFRTNRLQPWTH